MPEEAILKACQETGHRWRQRKLGPVATVPLFILQVLHGNTAIRHLRHLTKGPLNAAAYCKARMRLPLAVLQSLLRTTAEAAPPALQRPADWCGLRPYLVDGSSTLCPDEKPLRKAFGQPTGQKKGCGFPVPKLLGLFDAFTGLIQELLVLPLFTHEQSKVWQLHPLLQADDLLVGDRGFCSFGHLALLTQRGVQGLFRLHQRMIVSFRPHRKPARKGQKGKPTSRFLQRLGQRDQLVEWVKPKARPRWMSVEQYASLPATLRVREIRFPLVCKGQRTRCVTVVTTLLDPVRYPKEKIAELYHVRWRVETHFGQLKTTLKMRRIKCQTVAGVKKELVVYCLVYNLVHAVMLEGAARQHTTPDRISFVDTLRWLLSAEVGEELPDLVANPVRADRHEPRVIKDLQDTYRKMTKSRSYLRKYPNSRYGTRRSAKLK
jgi:hypothetical protein